MNIPHYEMVPNEYDETSGMHLISLVKHPAMEVAAVLLQEQEELNVTAQSLNKDKMYMTAPVIIPDKKILRKDPEHGMFTISFTASDIEQIRNDFFRSTGNLSLSNKNHDKTAVVKAQLIESWIIDDPKMDKSVALGFDLPKGTMMATYHILEEKVWHEEVVPGKLTSFSLEGRFAMRPVELAAMEEDTAFLELIKLLDELNA